MLSDLRNGKSNRPSGTPSALLTRLSILPTLSTLLPLLRLEGRSKSDRMKVQGKAAKKGARSGSVVGSRESVARYSGVLKDRSEGERCNSPRQDRLLSGESKIERLKVARFVRCRDVGSNPTSVHNSSAAERGTPIPRVSFHQSSFICSFA